jgi:hypothetical protein
MPIGTYLKKQKWQLHYEREGQRVDDLGFLALWIVSLSSNWNPVLEFLEMAR